MSSVTIARLASLVGAAVWFLGLPIVAMSGVLFVSDATYLWIGIVVTVLGVVIAPVVFAYPSGSPLKSARVVIGLGVLTCAGLVVSGALLVGGSVGLLGDKAPSWIPNASPIALTGLFVWILLASYSSRRSAILGRAPFWLGMLASGSWLLAALDSVVISVHTNATIPIDMISALLAWLCLPAWLVALAMRMRPEGGRQKQPATEIG
jgi:hypothetical protein